MYMYMYVYIHVCICMCIYIYIYIYTYMYVCMHTHNIYIYIYIYGTQGLTCAMQLRLRRASGGADGNANCLWAFITGGAVGGGVQWMGVVLYSTTAYTIM